MPEFKAGNYYKEIEAGTDKIIEAVKGVLSGDSEEAPSGEEVPVAVGDSLA